MNDQTPIASEPIAGLAEALGSGQLAEHHGGEVIPRVEPFRVSSGLIFQMPGKGMPLERRSIAGLFGRKQGAMRYFCCQFRMWLGQYRDLQEVEWSRVDRVVFVCAGNICRSPYGEARARAVGLTSSSFGLRTTGNDSVDPVALRVARRRGVDISAHRSRAAAAFTLEPGDLVLGMEPWHAQELRLMAGESQVSLVGLLSKPRRAHLEDPYGLSDEWFDTCFGLINRTVDCLAEKLK